MNRNELEHIIRASGEIAKVDQIIILGSQSVLGQYPELSCKEDASESRNIMIRSMEADIMIPESEEKTELVEAIIGELSSFHDTFGYYAQAVDQTTSNLPEGWRERLVRICNENTNDISGLCLEIHDLTISKLYAGRKKDAEFFHAAVNLGLLSKEILLLRLRKTPMSEERRNIIKEHIERGFIK
jgi:hypothetical protein